MTEWIIMWGTATSRTCTRRALACKTAVDIAMAAILHVLMRVIGL